MLSGEEWTPQYPSYAAVLDPDVFLPAAGQGAVALEARAGDEQLLQLLATITHEETMDMVAVERAFLVLLGAGCETPVGVRTIITGDRLRMRARVFEDDHPDPLESEGEGPREDPASLARELVATLSRTES